MEKEQEGKRIGRRIAELRLANTITLVSPSRTERYNLVQEKTYLFALPQQDCPDEQLVIAYPDGSEGPWVKVNFELGEKLCNIP